MPVSLAVGLSCVPSATLAASGGKRAAALTLGGAAALRWTAEYESVRRLKLLLNGGKEARSGSRRSVALSFGAGVLAHAVMTLALGSAGRLVAKTTLPLARVALPAARSVAVSSVCTGLGYAFVDKAYATVYLDCAAHTPLAVKVRTSPACRL
jgi:hypothetical protein